MLSRTRLTLPFARFALYSLRPRALAAAAAPEAAPCWRCSTPGDGTRTGFFCADCDTILPPPACASLFQQLGVGGDEFKVDARALKARFYALQERLHPDRWAQAGPEEQRLAQQASARVNFAFRTLQSPLRRAQCVRRE